MTEGIECFGLGVNLPQAGLPTTRSGRTTLPGSTAATSLSSGENTTGSAPRTSSCPSLTGMYTVSPDPSLPTDATADPGATSPSTTSWLLERAANPFAVNLTAGNPNIPFKEQDAELYLGDDWRIKDNLTLNLGIRWEFNQQGIQPAGRSNPGAPARPRRFWNPALPLNVTTLPQLPTTTTISHRTSVLPGRRTCLRGCWATTRRSSGAASAWPMTQSSTISSSTRPRLPLPSMLEVFACAAACPIGITGADVQSLTGGFHSYVGGNPGSRNNTRVTQQFHQPLCGGVDAGIRAGDQQ